MEPRKLYRRYKALLKNLVCQISDFTTIRHTAATLMLMNEIPIIVISRGLGHSQPSVTLDIYSHYLARYAGSGCCFDG
jgi:integrase